MKNKQATYIGTIKFTDHKYYFGVIKSSSKGERNTITNDYPLGLGVMFNKNQCVQKGFFKEMNLVGTGSIVFQC